MSFIKNIHIFMRSAELGSLSEAGRQQGLSPATVSHRVKQLELHLGVRLISRNTRSFKLTEAGEAFYECSQDILRAVERAESKVQQENGGLRGDVRLSAPLGLGRRVISDLISQFCEENSCIGVRMRLSDHPIDVIREGIDLAVVVGPMEDSSLIGRKLLDCPKVMCASPDYLKQHGAPQLPDDLRNHECISLHSLDLTDRRWVLQIGDSLRSITVHSRLNADDSDVLIRWALAGRGIVMRPLFEVIDYLRSGELVEVLGAFRPLPESLTLVYPERSLLPARTRLLMDFLVKNLKQKLAADEADYEFQPQIRPSVKLRSPSYSDAESERRRVALQ